MNASELPENLQHFLRASIPSFASAELLLFLARRGEERLTPVQIVEAMLPVMIDVPAVREYLVLFRDRGLVAGDFETGFLFGPSSPELRTAVDELARAYNERPVTLVRTIYALADDKIRSFAESFRLKKE